MKTCPKVKPPVIEIQKW